MVLVFSLITLIIAFSMQSTSYELNTAQVFSGLNFSLPFEYLPLALAVFGFTGISYGEIMAIPIGVLRKVMLREMLGIYKRLKIGFEQCKLMFG